ncbi:MAG: SDR family oxidoreductase [Rubrivivax sp.]
MNLTGRHCLVTGAAGDIGAATIARMLAAGAKVTAVDRSAEGLARLQSTHGDALAACRADVADENDVRRYAADAVRAHGSVHVFFANAGIEGDGAPIVSYDTARFQQVMAVNVLGVFLGIKHVAPAMADGGSIVVTSSVAGLRGSANMSAYIASKHAALGLARAAAAELAPRGIRVNAIHPTAVEGRMMESIASHLGSAQRQKMTSSIALGRYLEPDEVAALVMFLAGDDSRMITGASLPIDGGGASR